LQLLKGKGTYCYLYIRDGLPISVKITGQLASHMEAGSKYANCIGFQLIGLLQVVIGRSWKKPLA